MPTEAYPETMLAAQIVEFNKPHKIQQVPRPTPLGPYDVLLRVAVASYCHTDGMVRAGVYRTELPCIGSHEGAGFVVETGSAVTNLNIGDRVMAGILRNRCGHCHDCLGDENYRQYCSSGLGMIGLDTDGAFAEFMIVDSRESCIIPDKVSFETAAPLACAGRTIFRAILQAELKKGETIALVGAGGGLGHLGCQFAKAMGLMVIAIDARDEGITLAKDSGADVVFDARHGKDEIVTEVRKVTEGMGADATVNISYADSAAALACAVTKKHGLLVQIAQPSDFTIPFHELIFRDIRVKSSLISTRSEAQQMLQMVSDYDIKVKTRSFFGLESILDLIKLAESGKMVGKGILVIDTKDLSRIKEEHADRNDQT